VAPIYPEPARRARAEGTVVLACTIDPHGNVTRVQVTSGSPLFERAALDAVGQWVYEPTRLNGVPVAVLLEVTLHFELR
jgi:protein TonB